MIIFEYEEFKNWYINHINDPLFFTNLDPPLSYKYYKKDKENGLWIQKNSTINKKFNFISRKYSNFLNPPEKSTYLRISDNDDVYFYNLRKDNNLDFYWGDHFRFLKNDDFVQFHYTKQNENTKQVQRRYCSFKDKCKLDEKSKIILKYSLNKEIENGPDLNFKFSFPDINERNMIKDIINIPFNPEMTLQEAGNHIIRKRNTRFHYKGNDYIQKTGKKGGKYIILKGGVKYYTNNIYKKRIKFDSLNKYDFDDFSFLSIFNKEKNNWNINITLYKNQIVQIQAGLIYNYSDIEEDKIEQYIIFILNDKTKKIIFDQSINATVNKIY